MHRGGYLYGGYAGDTSGDPSDSETESLFAKENWQAERDFVSREEKKERT